MKIITLALLIPNLALAQLVIPAARWTTQRWDAQWIAPQDSYREFGVFHFRKSFTLAEKPASFIVHISADNRYRLFVNGKYVNEGPQLGDLRHWHFESLDIAGFLQTGNNVLAVQVVNFGELTPVNIMSRQTGLIVQGEGKVEAVVNSNNSWKCVRDNAFSPIAFRPGQPEVFYQYYVACSLEKLQASQFPWGWAEPDYNDKNWDSPRVIQSGAPFLSYGAGDERWELTPRNIPLMERIYQPLSLLRRAEGMAAAEGELRFPLSIPPKRQISLLFDQRQLTTAFPEFILSKGKGSEIKVTYAEAVFNDMKNKGHRDSIQGKTIHGVYDIVVADGGEKRMFTALSYRCFRYVQLDITTEEEPLVIEKLGSWFTAYPFQKNATFSSSDPGLAKVFDVGWHTARLCAYDTYMDCPYWERLQYIGDTRIQALVSYYNSGDDRLARNALEQFEWSMEYDGLTYSRYPSSLQQFIPNYSLVWVTMVYDYFMYRHDPDFVKSFLPGMRRVLEHFERYVAANGMMKLQPYWDFLDHTFNSKKIAEGGATNTLASNSLYYAYTLDMAAEMFDYFKDAAQSQKYAALSHQLKDAVKKNCWDEGKKMFADVPEKNHFSMHSNILAVLCGMVPAGEQAGLLKRIVEDTSLTRTTIYFDFYLARAMNRAGAGDQFYNLLGSWKDLVKLGLTTFPEGGERSECHAWSAGPNFEMLATFCGIESAAPGFEKVKINPQFGSLTKVEGTVPHWAGPLTVSFQRAGTKLSGRVILPKGTSGQLLWNQKTLPLREGENKIEL